MFLYSQRKNLTVTRLWIQFSTIIATKFDELYKLRLTIHFLICWLYFYMISEWDTSDGTFAIMYIFTNWRSTLVIILNSTRRLWLHLNQIINVWCIYDYQAQEYRWISSTSQDIAVNVFEILHLLSDLLIGRKFWKILTAKSWEPRVVLSTLFTW